MAPAKRPRASFRRRARRMVQRLPSASSIGVSTKTVSDALAASALKNGCVASFSGRYAWALSTTLPCASMRAIGSSSFDGSTLSSSPWRRVNSLRRRPPSVSSYLSLNNCVAWSVWRRVKLVWSARVRASDWLTATASRTALARSWPT
ncbi:hypothetical protein D3C81_1542670 [compost metagenome]